MRVIVFSVNAGKVTLDVKTGGGGIINAVQVLDLVCSSLGLVELRHVSQAFSTFFRGVYSLQTGNIKASDLKGDQSFLSFVNYSFCLIFSLL